ncbi:MAG: hypothetical protein K9N23_01455 [Akkermansiaceae bacterium]|nr:hypothetical protein [Akkermansiaceae bacterium]MCF7730317.1 hypothetical protein [Akkermansiaceae bacterium]
MIEWLLDHVQKLEKAFHPDLAKIRKKLNAANAKKAGVVAGEVPGDE